MEKILVAIDGSEPSFRALEHAAKLANALGIVLTVLIVKEFVVGRKNVLVVLNDDEIAAIQNQANEIILNAGEPKTNMLVETSRDAAFTIVDVAIEREMDLIVVGASGKGGFKSLLLGSVSQEILRKSACPVTIVH